MEQFIAEVLSQVPLVLAVLIIWWLMERRQSDLTEQREANAQQREVNRAATEKARNEHIDRLIDVTATLAAKIEQMADVTAGVQTAVDIGFNETAIAVGHLEARLSEHDDHVSVAASTIIGTNERAIKEHEARVLTAIEDSLSKWYDSLSEMVNTGYRDATLVEIVKGMEQLQADIKHLEQAPPARVELPDAESPAT